MLRGAHAITLDSKGRLALPTKYRDRRRDESEGQLICTIDITHPCLLLYPLPEWEAIEKKLRALSTMDPLERRLQRLLLGHASECELDGNGRFLLPAPLRQHAKLEKQVMLVGQLNKFEIWSDAAWLAQVDEDLGALPDMDWSQSDTLRDFSL